MQDYDDLAVDVAGTVSSIILPRLIILWPSANSYCHSSHSKWLSVVVIDSDSSKHLSDTVGVSWE